MSIARHNQLLVLTPASGARFERALGLGRECLGYTQILLGHAQLVCDFLAHFLANCRLMPLFLLLLF